jgi:uncharacterized membrane protein YfcA
LIPTLLFLAGVVAGILNVVGGGGSLLTLPLLLFLGLPAAVANGTNRIGILVQNASAVWGFHRRGILDWRWLGWLALPATVGAALGSWAALDIGEVAFRRILAGIMIAVAVWTLWDPLKKMQLDGKALSGRRRGLLTVAFFGVGFYGGFIQAGVGFLFLALIPLAGLDLVKGNAVKVLTVLAFTPLSLAIFAWNGKVDWALGLALAAGYFLGGLLGVRLTVFLGHRWLKVAVTAMVVLFALKLWLDS